MKNVSLDLSKNNSTLQNKKSKNLQKKLTSVPWSIKGKGSIKLKREEMPQNARTNRLSDVLQMEKSKDSKIDIRNMANISKRKNTFKKELNSDNFIEILNKKIVNR